MQLCLTVKAWTYHRHMVDNIDINVDWTTARRWCQKHFTDMVAIQNHAEVEYLNQFLPFNQAYYWIGIRKIDVTGRGLGPKSAWILKQQTGRKMNQITRDLDKTV